MVDELEPSPFLDQIVADTLANISERDEFDPATLERLESLMKTRDIVNFKHVVQALRTESEQ